MPELPLSTTPVPPEPIPPSRSVWTLRAALVGGVLLGVLGLLAGSSYIIFSLRDPDFPADAPATLVTTVGFAMIYLGLVLGVPLAITAWRGLRQRPSPPFILPLWLIAGLQVLALLVGQLILSLDLTPVALFPLFHALSTTLPPLLLVGSVALVLRPRLSNVTRRQAIAGVSFGAVITTGLAFALEIGGLFFAAAFGAAFIALQPGGLAQLETILSRVENGTLPLDQADLLSWLQNPWVIIALFIALAIVVPLIEETAKGLLVPLLSRWYEPTPVRGWLWGLIAGAGFAMTESLFNSAIDLDLWSVVVLLRAGTSILHCTTAGLTGLGWVYSRRRGNLWPLIGNFSLAFLGHAAWNGLTVLVVVASIHILEGGGSAIGAALAVLVAAGGLVLLGLAMLGVLIGVTYYLRRGLAN